MHPDFGLSTPLFIEGKGGGSEGKGVMEMGWGLSGRWDGDCLGKGVCRGGVGRGGMDCGRAGRGVVDIDFVGVFWGVCAFFGGAGYGYTIKIILPLYAR